MFLHLRREYEVTAVICLNAHNRRLFYDETGSEKYLRHLVLDKLVNALLPTPVSSFLTTSAFHRLQSLSVK